MASETAFSEEKLAAVAIGGATEVGPWQVTLAGVKPTAGPNWTALEGHLLASYSGGEPIALDPQSRNFWAPPQHTAERDQHPAVPDEGDERLPPQAQLPTALLVLFPKDDIKLAVPAGVDRRFVGRSRRLGEIAALRFQHSHAGTA